MTTVVLADDQDLVRSGLRLVLETRGIDVVGEAADGQQAVDVARRTGGDVVLMDIRMPVMNGIAATRQLMRLGGLTRVLVLTTYDLDEYVYAALCAGAAGFLLKATPPDRLVEGIRTVAAGEALLAPALTRRLIEEHISRPRRAAACRLLSASSPSGSGRCWYSSPAGCPTRRSRGICSSPKSR